MTASFFYLRLKEFELFMKEIELVHFIRIFCDWFREEESIALSDWYKALS